MPNKNRLSNISAACIPDLAELDTMSLLRPLTIEQRQTLAQKSTLLTLSKGQRFFEEGDACHGLHLVLSGLVKMYHLTTDGKEVVLHLTRSGQTFGEAFVFRQGEYPMSAAAVENTVALFLPTALVMSLVRDNPDLAEAMLSTLATRIYMFTRKLQAHGLREAPQRLAAYLLHTSRMRGHSSHITLDISRELLANMLGTARETVSRTLSRLTERGAISVHGRQVHIADSVILQRIADGLEEL